MATIDLHIHTNCSDGELTPFEIIDEAKKNGVKTIAIADHDTTEAYTKELEDYAKKNDINLINAVEISTKIDKCGIHVLGYNFDLKNKKLLDKLKKLRNARHDYLHNVATKVKELGYIIDTEELDKIDAVTKAHIASNVVDNKDNEELLLKEFNHLPDRGEFIETIMNEGCPAYVKKETITPKEASELIKESGGIVVLAHPVAYTYEDNLTEEDIEKLILDIKADGVEANYIYIDRNNTKHNDIDIWKNLANKLNLPTTIGSDFHKKDNLHPTIGLINEDIDLTEKEVVDILNFINKKTDE
jgi:predicted metal-dependent phosphoesterase TrpH